MKRLNRELGGLFKRGISFLDEIEKNERVALVYDTDVDGIASASLVLLALKRMGKEIKGTIPLTFETAKKLSSITRRFDRVITVDVPTDLIEKQLKKIKSKMLIIDHHPGSDLNSKDVVFVNPRLEDPEIYQPTSYIAYKMLLRFVRDRKWVAVLGTVGDYGIEDCRDLVKIKDKKSVRKTVFGKAAMLATGSIAIWGPEKTLEFFLLSKNLKELARNKKIILADKKFEGELKINEASFKRNLEVHGRLMMSKIKPKYRGVGSALINRLSTENPEKILILFEDVDNKYRIHGRNQTGRIHVGKLFKKLCGGGGHREAGAGTVKKKEINRFKEELLRELANFKGKGR